MLKQIIFSLKPIYFQIKYPGRFHSPKKQMRWEKDMQVVISSGSSVSIGEGNHFRSRLQLRAVHGGNIKIGNNCFFNSNVSITSLKSITIGNNVRIANNTVIVDHDHDYMNNMTEYQCDEVVIGDDVWIGANSVILKGVHIGNHAVIAAGSVVRHDVPDHTVAGGVPASILKEI